MKDVSNIEKFKLLQPLQHENNDSTARKLKMIIRNQCNQIYMIKYISNIFEYIIKYIHQKLDYITNYKI